jgi:hypothetical protein
MWQCRVVWWPASDAIGCVVQLKILCGGGSSSSSSTTTTRQAEKACVYFKKTRFILKRLGLFV